MDTDEASAEAPFETIMSRLGEIVGELEGGEIALERALALFEEGIRLSRQGAARLDDAETRVEQLLKSSSTDGPPKTRALASAQRQEPEKDK